MPYGQEKSRWPGIGSNKPIDISIPLHFNGPQPNAFGVEIALSAPVKVGNLAGDTRRGGSCNFERLSLIPHCNGTHTECIGHITHERISVLKCLRDIFIPAVLVTVMPSAAIDQEDSYPVKPDLADLLITRSMLAAALKDVSVNMDKDSLPALIIRTLPNDEAKMTMRYGDVTPPYFSTEAMHYIVDCGFGHLLVDLPSIDRMSDEGKLANHRIFWGMQPGSFEADANSRMNNTITELIFVPNEVPDGEYILNLQIAPFDSDSAPSRPILLGKAHDDNH